MSGIVTRRVRRACVSSGFVGPAIGVGALFMTGFLGSYVTMSSSESPAVVRLLQSVGSLAAAQQVCGLALDRTAVLRRVTATYPGRDAMAEVEIDRIAAQTIAALREMPGPSRMAFCSRSTDIARRSGFLR
ncbi:MAG: hypothetical protein ACRYGN_25010 [Janthinobacterium lividum]